MQGVSPSANSQTTNTRPAAPQMVKGLRINNLQSTSATLSWEPLVGTGQMGKCIARTWALSKRHPKHTDSLMSLFVWIRGQVCDLSC